MPFGADNLLSTSLIVVVPGSASGAKASEDYECLILPMDRLNSTSAVNMNIMNNSESNSESQSNSHRSVPKKMSTNLMSKNSGSENQDLGRNIAHTSKSKQGRDVLPEVHHEIASSDIPVPFKTIYEGWKDVPKIHRYSPNEIQVVVHRRSGQVETITPRSSFSEIPPLSSFSEFTQRSSEINPPNNLVEIITQTMLETDIKLNPTTVEPGLNNNGTVIGNYNNKEEDSQSEISNEERVLLLEQTLKHKTEQLSQSLQRYQQILNENSDLKEYEQEWKKSISLLEELSSNKDKLIDREQENSELKIKIQELQLHIQSLQNQSDDEQTLIKSNISQLDEKLSQFLLKTQELEKQNATLNENERALRGIITILEENKEESEHENLLTTMRIQQLEALVYSLRNDKTMLTDQSAILESSVSRLNDELSQVKQEREVLQKQNSELMQNNEEPKETILTLQEEKDHYKDRVLKSDHANSQLNMKIQQLEAQINSFQNNTSMLNDQSAILKSTVSKLNDDLSQLKQERDGSKKQNSELMQNEQELKKTISTLQEEKDHNKDRVLKSDHANSGLNMKITELMAQIAMLEEQNGLLTSKISQQENDLSQLSQESHKLNLKTIEDVKSRLTQYAQMFEKSRIENARLQLNLQQKQGQIDALQSGMSRLKHTINRPVSINGNETPEILSSDVADILTRAENLMAKYPNSETTVANINSYLSDMTASVISMNGGSHQQQDSLSDSNDNQSYDFPLATDLTA